jgi:TPR repeat protein
MEGVMKSARGSSAVAALLFQMIAAGMIAILLPHVAMATEPDIPQLQSGADHGSVQHEIELGAAYLLGRGVPKDEKQAAYWYEKAANSGDPGAQQQIGYFYAAGIGVERSPQRATKWFERAVASGSISAKVNLGVAYVWGQGVRKDPQLAAQLFREAAEKGSGIGACYLGDSYHFGIGVAKDDAKAMHWFEVGAKRHDARAAYDVAFLLLHQPNQGDNKRAIKYLRESAAGGYVMAKHQLALQLLRDHEGAPSEASGEAMKLLEETAAEGFWKSSAILGILYRDGQGTPKDKEAAYYHFRIAALQGGDKAATLLASDLAALKLDLDASNVAALDAKATSWTEGHNIELEYVNAPRGLEQTFPALATLYPQGDAHAGKALTVSGREALFSGEGPSLH